MVELEFPVAKCFNQNIVQQHPSLSAQWRTAPILTATSHRIKVETEITWAHIGGLRTTDIAEYGSPKAERRLKKSNRDRWSVDQATVLASSKQPTAPISAPISQRWRVAHDDANLETLKSDDQ